MDDEDTAIFSASAPVSQSTPRKRTPGVKKVPAVKKVADKKTDAGGSKKRSTLEEICEAIKAVGEERKGASYQAIKKYILSNHEESEYARIKALIRKSVLKGIENGTLDRPAASKDIAGAQGYFILSKTTQKTEGSKTAKAAPRVRKTLKEPDGEVMAKNIKSKKDNVSNATVNNLEKASKPRPTKQKPDKIREALKVVPGKSTKVKALKKNTITKTEVKERKDVSDSEFVVKKKSRKSLKSYSSDTEVTVKSEGTKETAAKRPKKKTEPKDAAENKASTSKASKVSKDKGTKKLYKPKSDVDEVKQKAVKKRNKEA